MKKIEFNVKTVTTLKEKNIIITIRRKFKLLTL